MCRVAAVFNTQREPVIVPDWSSSSGLSRWRLLTRDGCCVSVCVVGVVGLRRRRGEGEILSMASSAVSQSTRLPSSRLSSSAHLYSRRILDYSGRRMCMAELLGRAAKI